MRVTAIDPGALHTGVVHMDEHRVIDVTTISYPKGCGSENHAVIERAWAIWKRLSPFLTLHTHDEVVIEGFLPFQGRKTQSHVIPMIVGFLCACFLLSGEKFTIQTSRQVLNPKSTGNLAHVIDDLKGRRRIYPGCELITNEHLRSAFAHGLYFLNNNTKEDQWSMRP